MDRGPLDGSRRPFSLYAVAGLIVLTSETRLTEGWWTMNGVGGVARRRALDVDRLPWPRRRWWPARQCPATTRSTKHGGAFAEGKANGFAIMALAIAVIAGNEARSPERVTPAWSALVAMVAGVASFIGWVLGIVLRNRPRQPLKA